MHLRDLDNLSRSDLIEKAEALGIDKASLLTRAELADEIVRRSVEDPIERRIARGLLGLARDLVASVLERGLHLPEAAALIRGTARGSWIPPKPPIATVTLAEIYAAQGHRGRALAVLDEVLETESDHAAARVLRDKIAATPVEGSSLVDPTSEGPVEPESERVASVGASEMSPSTAESEWAARPPGAGAAEPFGMLDDAPLPERYDVDEVVMMPVDPRTVFLYWEVRSATLEEAQKRAAEGRLVIRLLAVTASWEGPGVETRDIEIDDRVGDRFVRDLPGGAVLRAAIGWRARAGFDPLSVAMELTAPSAGPAPIGASALSRFSDEGLVPIEGVVANDVALAVERARHRVARETLPRASGASSWPAMGSAPWSMGDDLRHPGANV